MLNFSTLGSIPNILNSDNGTVLKYCFDTYVTSTPVPDSIDFPYVLLMEDKNDFLSIKHKYFRIDTWKWYEETIIKNNNLINMSEQAIVAHKTAYTNISDIYMNYWSDVELAG